MMRAVRIRAAVAQAVALALVGLLLGGACRSDEPRPPTSPLADTSTPPASTATLPPAPTRAPATPPPPPAGTPRPGGGAVGAGTLDQETAAGQAIELLGEWLGIPDTQLSLVAVEEVTWPDSCHGVDRPGLSCAQVLTPGFQVLLLDAFGGSHAVHLDAGGNGTWAGEVQASGTVEAVDAAARTFTVRTPEGEPLDLRTAPGTRIDADGGEPGLPGLKIGVAVVVAYDQAPDGAQPPVAAWVALDPSGG